MGKLWDHGVPSALYWKAILRTMKPGAYLLAFSGTRTYHRLGCAIEDAGFEIFDMVQWLHGQGMPKGKNFDGTWDGWGTTLKPASEPIALARKPLDGTFENNLATHGVGALNIDACRVEAQGRPKREVHPLRDGVEYAGNAFSGRVDGSLQSSKAIGTTDLGRWPTNLVHDGSDEVLGGFPKSKGQQGDVRGTEPSRTGDENTACYGEFGRVAFAKRGDAGSAARFFNTFRDGEATADTRYTEHGGTNFAMLPGQRRELVGVDRFYYCAKASKAERGGSKHPTIKPLALMRWLVRLVTPPNGVVLDPFGGTGTTAQAAYEEGFRTIVAENDSKSQDDIRRRVAAFNV